MPEYKAAENLTINDITSISYAPDWYNQFMRPIDFIRSTAKPKFTKAANNIDPFDDLIITSTWKESRCHAFYRLLGLPVSDGTRFYNPGFDPFRTIEDDKKNATIDSAFNSSDLKDIVTMRETDFEENKQIFARQDLASSIYALSLRHPRSFQILDTGLAPFNIDKQAGTIDKRRNILDSFFVFNSRLADKKSTTISYFSNKVQGFDLTGFRHILKPFIQDPFINKVVNPFTKIICVPFLPNNNFATKITNEQIQSLYRPKIEEIIENRLNKSITEEDQKIFFQRIQKLLSNNEYAAVEDNEELGLIRATVIALADETNIDNIDLNDVIGDFSNIQFLMVGYFVKLIKVAVKTLYESVNILNKTLKKMNWVPICDLEGPEFTKGARLYTSDIEYITDFDQRIANTRSLLAQAEATKPPQEKKFPSPPIRITSKDNIKLYSAQLKDLIDQRDRLASQAFKALKDIELITGEISGLGFIDIFAIYASLWALDEKSLINLLDDDAFNRMVVFETDIVTNTVRNRLINNEKQSISETLTNFEEILINFLSFADKEYNRQLENPLKTEGGSVYV